VLAVPALIWLTAFLLGPMLLVLVVAFLKKGTYGGLLWELDFTHWTQIFNDSYLKIMFLSFVQAFATASLTVAIGFLLAWSCSTLSGGSRKWAIGLIALPSFLNLIVRIYAIKLFVGFEGPLQGLLRFLRIPFDEFYFSSNQSVVFWGMFSSYLPFAFLPLYAAMEKFDFSLIEAARDLGANTVQTVFQVLIPNLKRALMGAFVLVFIPSLGEFIIPDLLGGAKQMYLGNLISEQVLRARNWPTGAALAVLLISAMLIFYFLGARPNGPSSEPRR